MEPSTLEAARAVLSWIAQVNPTEWISAGGVLIAALAYWRFGKVRTRQVRATVRSQCAEVRLGLESLAAIIPAAVESRARIAAMTGQTDALQRFRSEADSDRAAIDGLRKSVDRIRRIPFLAGYAAVEKRAVAAYQLNTEVRQLREKYQRALDADNDARHRRQDEILALIKSGRP